MGALANCGRRQRPRRGSGRIWSLAACSMASGRMTPDDIAAALMTRAGPPNLIAKPFARVAQGEGHWTVGTWSHCRSSRRPISAVWSAPASRGCSALPTKDLALTARLHGSRRRPVLGAPVGVFLDGRQNHPWPIADEGGFGTCCSRFRSRARREIVQPLLGGNSPQKFLEGIGRNSARRRPAAAAPRTRRGAGRKRRSMNFRFASPSPPSPPLRVSCKQWQGSPVARPGASWFKYVLRAEPRWQPAEDDLTRRK